MNAEHARLLFGTDEALAPALQLRCGRLATRLRDTRLGPVWFDGREVWHGVDFLFRDADWGTPAPVVDHLEHESDADGFSVRLRGHIAAAARMDFQIAIVGDAESLSYEAKATAQADLATNRTGVVLMHPLSVCGRPISVEHTDGRVSASTFPTLVAPWPPFMLVRAVRHEFTDGAWASCRFEGEDFELEDQRNNADASFKTYSRSNMMPRPYVLREGACLRQAVRLRIEPPLPRARAAAPDVGGRRVEVRIGPPLARMPDIGIAIAPSHDLHATQPVRDALYMLSPALLHLVLDRPDAAFDVNALRELHAAAGMPALRIDIAGVDATQARAQLMHVAVELRHAAIVPERIAVFPSTPPVVEAARAAFPRAILGGGTAHFFTQLNRIEDLGCTDFLSFTTASVVHGADDEEIMAGLRSLAPMMATIRSRLGDRPVHVGPSSIGARRSPLGGQPASDGSRRLALARRDPRTRGLFGAAWALGYIVELAAARAQSITLFDLLGDAALLPDGTPTPAFELLRQLTRPALRREACVSHPDRLAVLALRREGEVIALLGNLTGEPLQVHLQGHDGASNARVLDLDALADAAAAGLPMGRSWRQLPVDQGTLALPAYAIASV